jgi:hypothetical protein
MQQSVSVQWSSKLMGLSASKTSVSTTGPPQQLQGTHHTESFCSTRIFSIGRLFSVPGPRDGYGRRMPRSLERKRRRLSVN